MHLLNRRSCVQAGLVVLLSGIFILSGCASEDHAKEQKEVAKQKWNEARASVMVALARQQFENGNHEACRKTLDDALAMNPKDVDLWLLSARLGIEQGNLEAAYRDCDQARQVDAKSPDSFYYQGVIYQRWQKPDAALEAYQQASELRPAELSYIMARSEMMVSLDRAEEAIGLLKEKAAYFENSAALRDSLGQMLVRKRRYDEAANVLRQASILKPDDASVQEHYAMALYFASRFGEAKLAIGRLFEQKGYAQRADLYTALGECNLELNKPREARDAFQAAAQLDSSVPGLYLSLAKAAMAMDDFPRTEMALKKAAALSPANPEVQLMAGYLRFKQNRLDEAMGSFRNASALAPTDPTPLCMIGCVLEKQNRRQEALAYYTKALKLKPDDELAARLLASLGVDE